MSAQEIKAAQQRIDITRFRKELLSHPFKNNNDSNYLTSAPTLRPTAPAKAASYWCTTVFCSWASRPVSYLKRCHLAGIAR